CPDVTPIIVTVGGANEVIDKDCAFVLPRDFGEFPDIEVEPNDPVLDVFALTVKSNQSIIIEPGITLVEGAELFLEPGQMSPTTDLDRNFIETRGYDETGKLQSAGRQYFDGMGRPTQHQYMNLDKDIILASETLYDAYGRAVISTANAPVWHVRDPIDAGCDNALPGEDLVFNYKEGFITADGGEAYDRTKFDRYDTLESSTNELAPVPLDHTVEGSLGWYYGPNNGNSNVAAYNETGVAQTGYPYSRTLFHHDGTEDPKGQTVPGDVYRAGAGILAVSDKEGVQDDDTFMTDYREIVITELGLAFDTAFAGHYQKQVFTDENGKKSVTYQDQGGQSLINLYYGRQSSPITKSYQFYDEVGRLIHSVSPNGVAAYEAGMAYDSLDKTSYVYNARGLLTDVYEPEGGHTRYIYRNDGSIRFSQNEKQRTNGRYSYTHYDASDRPFKSGEYLPDPSGIVFGSSAMLEEGILESSARDGGLSDALGQHFDEIETVYDEADDSLPYAQEFVEGNVSITKKQGANTTWYSYDHLGRVVWIVQDIVGLGRMKTDYIYGPNGQVKEVIFEDLTAGNDYGFRHFYEYNADGALVTVSTQSEVASHLYDKTVNARYQYYSHGPLKRIELGDHLQGIDFIYTADGKLKAINDGSKNANADPGQDAPAHNGFETDHFGQTLTYHANDYTNNHHSPYNLTSSTHEDQYNGNLKGQTWHSPVDAASSSKGYGYRYDERDQLIGADFARGTDLPAFREDPSSRYDVNIPGGYDPNGNIETLVRRDHDGSQLHDFDYKYMTGKNQLDRIIDNTGTTTLRDYEYNKIGELEKELDLQANTGRTVEYDVTGKVRKIYRVDMATGTPDAFPSVEYTYDDKGFRLSKTLYDAAGAALTRTWYIRDAAGQVLSMYEENVAAATAATPIEFPIYGASRLGVFKPANHTIFYELADHLGNVRVVIGDPMPLTLSASMESARAMEEEAYFQSLPETRTTVPDFINHTPSANANKAIRLNNVKAGEAQSIGPSISLKVRPGDTIRSEVFVKYFKPQQQKSPQLGALLLSLPALSATSTLGDPGTALSQSSSKLFPLPIAMGNTETVPRAYLNYVLFDKDMNMLDAGYKRVSQAAEIPTRSPELHTHERLSEELIIEDFGYLQVYVSNSSQQETEVFFDDLSVMRLSSNVVRAHDYYPYGLKMVTGLGNIEDEDYRWGFQGAFAEEDEETGWNSFELRMYDPVIGRWTSTDPAGQFWSPYLGMGNSPINQVDPDGAFSKFGAWWRNGFSMDGVYQSGGEWGYSRNFTYTDVSEFGTLTGVGQEFFYQDALSGNVAANAWNSPLARYYFPDFVNIGAGFDGIAGVGGYTNFDLQWVTRGPDASFYPALTVTQAIGGGFSVDATVNVGGTNYLGSVQDIRRSMLQTSIADGSVTYWGSAGLTAAGKIGVEGLYTRTDKGYGLIGRQLIIGGGLPAGLLPLNGAGGVSNTFILHDFYHGQ
ncbi:MAG: hypothetical protein MJA30_19940, partial [Cytophagales bacterium]|nr:hypothetical protein [Cytophagales bacterium]